MEEFQQFYSKVVLIKSLALDFSSIKGKNVDLELDLSFNVGKSVAVLSDGNVIGHLTSEAAVPIYIHLRFGYKVEAQVYDMVSGFANSICYSNRSKAPEVGVQIRLFFADMVDGERRISSNNQAKGFLSYIMEHHINSFPGVTWSNCPPSLQHLI